MNKINIEYTFGENENDFCEIINDVSDKYKCVKNTDSNDYPVILQSLRDDKEYLFNIEKINKRWWSGRLKKPFFPSGLLIIPITDIIPMVENSNDIIRFAENEEENFLEQNIEKLNELFIYNRSEFYCKQDRTRMIIKMNADINYMAIIRPELIRDALNNKLSDQSEIDKRIMMQKKLSFVKKYGFRFFNNVWFNPNGKKIKGVLYNTKLYLIIGTLQDDSGIIWTDRVHFPEILSSL